MMRLRRGGQVPVGNNVFDTLGKYVLYREIDPIVEDIGGGRDMWQIRNADMNTVHQGIGEMRWIPAKQMADHGLIKFSTRGGHFVLVDNNLVHGQIPALWIS